MVDGVLYVLTVGCQWPQLPMNFPLRITVHGWFARWRSDGVPDPLRLELYQQAGEVVGKKTSPTTAIIDSQGVNSAEKGGLGSTPAAMTPGMRSKERSATPMSAHWA